MSKGGVGSISRLVRYDHGCQHFTNFTYLMLYLIAYLIVIIIALLLCVLFLYSVCHKELLILSFEDLDIRKLV